MGLDAAIASFVAIVATAYFLFGWTGAIIAAGLVVAVGVMNSDLTGYLGRPVPAGGSLGLPTSRA